MSIVNINVSVTLPPKPSQLLKSGVLVSQGGTSLTPGTITALTAKTDLKPLLREPFHIVSGTVENGLANITVSEALPLDEGQSVRMIISGMVPEGYNGVWDMTVTGEKTLQFTIGNSPGEITKAGVLQPFATREIEQMNNSYWAQGVTRSVYLLELGLVTNKEAVKSLGEIIDEDLSLGLAYQNYFSWLVPRAWDDEEDFRTLTGQYTAPGTLVYFFVTTTTETYKAWEETKYKTVFAGVEAPDVPDTEFSMAGPFQSSLINDPGSSNMVPPMAYRYMFGLTNFKPAGNSKILKALQAANINYISSAAEGGISNKMLVAGHMLDGMPFNYWYSIAWCAVTLSTDVANEVINGSNNTVNPLYYEQAGINRLQNRALKTLRSAVSYGLVLGRVEAFNETQDAFNEKLEKGVFAGNAVINAVPFGNYTSLNPSAYQDGFYGGLSAVITPKRGFESITFNLNITNFVGA